jgi:hypothetical protein
MGEALLSVSDSPAHTHTHKAYNRAPHLRYHQAMGGRNGINTTDVRNRTTGFATPSRVVRSHPGRSQIATLNTHGIRRRTTARRYEHTHIHTCLLRCGASDEVVERLFQAEPGAVCRRRPHAGGVCAANQE